MGELTEGMKDKLHSLVDESNTDEIFTLISGVRENDLDVPMRLVVDLPQNLWVFLGDVADEIHLSSEYGVDRASAAMMFIAAAQKGAKDGMIKRLMEKTGSEKKAKGKRG